MNPYNLLFGSLQLIMFVLPGCIIVLVIRAWHPSLLLLAISVGILYFSQHSITLYALCRKQALLARHVLDELLQNWEIRHLRLEDYIDDATRQELTEPSVAGKIVLLSIAARSNQPTVSDVRANLAAYPNPLGSSVIFVRQSDREDVSDIERFFVLHEIAHVNFVSSIMSRLNHGVLLRYSLLYLPALWLTKLVAARYAIVAIMMIDCWFSILPFRAEASADWFASGYFLRAYGEERLSSALHIARHRCSRLLKKLKTGWNSLEIAGQEQGLRVIEELIREGKSRVLIPSRYNTDLASRNMAILQLLLRSATISLVFVAPRVPTRIEEQLFFTLAIASLYRMRLLKKINNVVQLDLQKALIRSRFPKRDNFDKKTE
jgi:hypothetical protein